MGVVRRLVAIGLAAGASAEETWPPEWAAEGACRFHASTKIDAIGWEGHHNYHIEVTLGKWDGHGKVFFDLSNSDAEIDAYIDSDAEKARMRARGAAFFKAKGVDTSDPQSYCALGREEIQKSSRIGSLLKAK